MTAGESVEHNRYKTKSKSWRFFFVIYNRNYIIADTDITARPKLFARFRGPETKRCISAIVDPVSGKRTLNKAQQVNPNQLKELTTQNRLK